MICLSAIIDGLPNICGAESVIDDAIRSAIDRPVALGESKIDLSRIRSAFAIALAHASTAYPGRRRRIFARRRSSAISDR